MLNKILMFVLRGVRPLLGKTHCRYPVSCTNYALLQLKEKPLIIALWRITKRVILCNPFYTPTLKKDDYEESKKISTSIHSSGSDSHNSSAKLR